MAVHPLRPATHHRLGEPLPLQLANGTQSSLTALIAFIIMGCPIIIISGISIRFQMLSLAVRQVLYALLTRPPWLPWCKHHFPIDLHVLSILSAFILSQDQTLHSTISFHLYFLSHIFDASSVFFFFLYSICLPLSSQPLPQLTKIILSNFISFVNRFFIKFRLI